MIDLSISIVVVAAPVRNEDLGASCLLVHTLTYSDVHCVPGCRGGALLNFPTTAGAGTAGIAALIGIEALLKEVGVSGGPQREACFDQQSRTGGERKK